MINDGLKSSTLKGDRRVTAQLNRPTGIHMQTTTCSSCVHCCSNTDIILDENVSIGFWDYEGKRSEILMPKKMAGVLARSILLCVEGSLSEIGINV